MHKYPVSNTPILDFVFILLWYNLCKKISGGGGDTDGSKADQCIS